MFRLKTALVGFTGFMAGAFMISFYRYWFTFRQLCGGESGLTSGAQSLMGCPGFLDVLLITSISPGFFFLSVLIGFVSIYAYSRF